MVDNRIWISANEPPRRYSEVRRARPSERERAELLALAGEFETAARAARFPDGLAGEIDREAIAEEIQRGHAETLASLARRWGWPSAETVPADAGRGTPQDAAEELRDTMYHADTLRRARQPVVVNADTGGRPVFMNQLRRWGFD